MSLLKKALANGGLLIGSLVISIAIAEYALRLLAPQPAALSHQDRYGLPLHYPGITRYLSQFGHKVSINSAGMRDVEHTLEKPADAYRVLVLGDSFMEAVQVPFDSAFSAILQRTLPPVNGRKIEVINAGVSGWGTDDALRYFDHYGRKYSPDLVVLAMTLHNDISDNLRERWHSARSGSLQVQQVPAMSAWKFRELQLKAFLASHFHLYQLLRRVKHEREMARAGAELNAHVVALFRNPQPPEIEYGFNLTEQLIGRLQSQVADAGSKLVVVLLPIVYQLSDTTFTQFVARAGVAAEQMDAMLPQQRIREAAARHGVPVIDLLPAFRAAVERDKAQLYIEWDGHWNEAGHRLAAEVVVHELVNSEILP